MKMVLSAFATGALLFLTVIVQSCKEEEEASGEAAEETQTVGSGGQPTTNQTGQTTVLPTDDGGDDSSDSSDNGNDGGTDGDGGNTDAPATTSLEAGDILVLREDSGTGIGDNGEIMAFSKTDGFKGYAYDSAGVSPWYGYGLRLSYDYFSGKYYVETGSGDSNLAISVRRFPNVASYPHTLGAWTEGPASDALYFQGAFSEEYNSLRYVAVNDGQSLDVYNFGTKVPDCTINLPAGKHARAVYSGTQSFVFTPHVGYTLGTGTGVTGYGVAKLTGSCSGSGGTPATFDVLFEDTNFDSAKVTSLLHVRTQAASGTDSIRSDILVTVGGFLYGQKVLRWHYDGSAWALASNPFMTYAEAVYQNGWGDLYTLESDSNGSYIRRYAVEEVSSGSHFVETVYTDAEQKHLRSTALGKWLIVMPTLP